MNFFEIGKVYAINDINVKAVRNPSWGMCTSCAFYINQTRTCDTSTWHSCTAQSDNNDIIFEKYEHMVTETDEPKYTVREVLAAFGVQEGVGSTMFVQLVDEVSEELKRTSDPEYLTYLRLKEKFENRYC